MSRYIPANNRPVTPQETFFAENKLVGQMTDRAVRGLRRRKNIVYFG